MSIVLFWLSATLSTLGRIRAGLVLSGQLCRHTCRPVSQDSFYVNHQRRKLPGLTIFRMNWLQPPSEPPSEESPVDPEAPSESNLNYWAARLTPLHDPTPGYETTMTERAEPKMGKEVVFVACNRVGVEEGT